MYYTSVCNECGHFASHIIFDNKHHFWNCQHCLIRKEGDPWKLLDIFIVKIIMLKSKAI